MIIINQRLVLTNLNKLIYQSTFCTTTNPINSSIENNLTTNNLDNYQFNNDLIKRIKKNQLFNYKFINIKKDKLNPKILISTDVLKYIPSVSKIINETMTEDNIRILDVWKNKMIKKLGLIGFQKYQNDIFSRGKRLHKNIEFKLKNDAENIKIDDDLNGYWNSLQPILNEIKDIYLIETKLEHPNLLYKGIVDCVVSFNKVNTVVDWKTSDKVKDNLAKLYDAPIQTVAYLGALNQSNLLDFEINKIAVVVAYNNGRVANYHQLNEKDCLNFWLIWTKKVEQYWIKTLSTSPADPCLINYFNDLLLIIEDKNKKIYFFPNQNSLKDNKNLELSNKKRSKTKDELIELLKRR